MPKIVVKRACMNQSNNFKNTYDCMIEIQNQFSLFVLQTLWLDILAASLISAAGWRLAVGLRTQAG